MQYKKADYKSKKKLKINWNKILFLAPRVLAIIYILFIGIFSLGNEGVGIIIELLPAVLLIIILILTWKKPVSGGIIFLILGVLFTLFFHTTRTVLTFFLVSLPPILIGILLLLSRILKRE
jgi:hypothetical protein